MAITPNEGVDPTRNRHVEKNRDRYPGTYIGYVKDRNDPLKRGRIRVWIPALFPKDATSSWTDWALPSSMGLVVPPLGTPVEITFEQGYITNPHYKWGWLKGTTPANSDAPEAGKEQDDPTWLPSLSADSGGLGLEVNTEQQADPATMSVPKYPYNKVVKTEGGHIVEFDDTPGAKRIRIYHASGTTVLIDPDGSVSIRAEGNLNMSSRGDMQLSLGQGATFKANYLDGAGIAVGASGVHITGPACTILGRPVVPNGEDI